MNQLQKFITEFELSESQAASVLGASRATIYNNLQGECSPAIIERIRSAKEEVRMSRVGQLIGEIQERAAELAALTAGE